MTALSRLTILTASRCLHGDDVRENLFEDVARLFHDLDMGMTPLSVFLPHAPVPAHFRRDKVKSSKDIPTTPFVALEPYRRRVVAWLLA